VGLFGEKVTVEVLRPLGVVGVRIDVVVSEAFHVLEGSWQRPE
jgi:hypothetical protein